MVIGGLQHAGVERADLGASRPFGLIYGAAHFGKSLTWYLSELLFAYALTEICGLSPWAMSDVLALSFIFSAGVDPIIGWLLAKRIGSVDQACRFQLAGAIVSGLSLLLFSTTALAPAPWRFVYALMTSSVFRLAYAFYDVPQNAILGLVKADAVGRMRLSAIRILCSGLATLALAWPAALVIGSNAKDGPARFLALSAAFAVAGGLSALALQLYVPGATRPRPTAPGAPPAASPADEGRRSVLGITVIMTVFVAAIGVFVRLEPYFAKIAFATGTARTVILSLIPVGGVASQPFWVWLARRVSDSAAIGLAAALLVLSAALFLFAAPVSLALSGLGGFAFGAASSGLGALLWARFADAVAAPCVGRKAIAPTVAFAILTGAIKLGSAISVLTVGQVLAGLNYRSAAAAASPALLGPMIGAPLCGMIVCVLGALYLELRGRFLHRNCRRNHRNCVISSQKWPRAR